MNKIKMLLIVALGLASCSEEPDATRETPEMCDNERPNQNFNPASVTRTNGTAGCDSDDDCTEGLNGRCVAELGWSTRTCDYDKCVNDDGCESNEACSCGQDQHQDYLAGRSDANSCVIANCRTNEDCGDQFCKPDHGEIVEVGDRVIGYYCTTESDDCRNDSDCDGVGKARCTFGADKWVCMGGDG